MIKWMGQGIMGVLVGTLVVGVSGWGHAKVDPPMPAQMFLPVGQEAKMLLPAEVVQAGVVKHLLASPNGNHLVIAFTEGEDELIRKQASQMAAPAPDSRQAGAMEMPPTKVSVWNYATRRLRHLPGLAGLTQVVPAAFLGSTDLLLVNAVARKGDEAVDATMVVNVATGARVWSVPSDGAYTVTPSSTRPIALVTRGNEVRGGVDVGILGANGVMSPVPTLAGKTVTTAMWDGSGAQVIARVKDPEQRWVVVRGSTLISLSQAEVQQLMASPAPRPGKINLQHLPGPELGGVARGSQTVVLSTSESKPGEKPPMLIVGYGALPQTSALDPQNRYVAFAVDGGLMVRDLVSVPLKVMEDARKAAEKQRALSNAKQVGLAVIMFSADNDDQLPDPASWARDVEPYLRSNAILATFMYTYSGPRDVTQVENPSQVEMGYVVGPGGRAVVYLDGSAKWVPDAPPPSTPPGQE